jgi:hypothetical protein
MCRLFISVSLSLSVTRLTAMAPRPQ